MKILHYNLGLPPYRSGGLTKYSTDLMIEQSKNKDVYLLFPGRYTISNKLKIKKFKNFRNIKVFEILNPKPVPLMGGVENIDEFIKPIENCKKESLNFLNTIKPDIIHIHTLMGLPIEFIRAAKELKIKIIFTTHDYYGLCPKVNFLKCDGCLNMCHECNKNSYSIKKIKIMQSSVYRTLKESPIIKYIRKYVKKNDLKKESNRVLIRDFMVGKELEYEKLREYYIEILNLFDKLHFNSSITKDVYNKFCKTDGDIISITHSSIKDNRLVKDFKNNKLRILFLGSLDEYKGCLYLINVLKDIDNSLWELNIYGNNYEIKFGCENIRLNGRYKQEDLSNIMINNDILIVPSLCKETFGFTLLEGLSNGMPIIATDTVGSKDLIENNETGFIVKKNELKKYINLVINNRKLLEEINRNIINRNYIFEIENHEKIIENYYKRVINE